MTFPAAGGSQDLGSGKLGLFPPCLMHAEGGGIQKQKFPDYCSMHCLENEAKPQRFPLMDSGLAEKLGPLKSQCGLRLPQQARLIVDFTH